MKETKILAGMLALLLAVSVMACGIHRFRQKRLHRKQKA